MGRIEAATCFLREINFIMRKVGLSQFQIWTPKYSDISILCLLGQFCCELSSGSVSMLPALFGYLEKFELWITRMRSITFVNQNYRVTRMSDPNEYCEIIEILFLII